MSQPAGRSHSGASGGPAASSAATAARASATAPQSPPRSLQPLANAPNWAEMTKGQKKRWHEKQKKAAAAAAAAVAAASGAPVAAAAAATSQASAPAAAAAATAAASSHPHQSGSHQANSRQQQRQQRPPPQQQLQLQQASQAQQPSQPSAGDQQAGLSRNARRRMNRRRRGRPDAAAGSEPAGEDDEGDDDADAADIESTPLAAASPAKSHANQQQPRDARLCRKPPQPPQQQSTPPRAHPKSIPASSEVESLKAQIAQLQRELEEERVASHVFKFTTAGSKSSSNATATVPSTQQPAPFALPAFTFPPANAAANPFAFFAPPPDVVPYVPAVAPLPPEELEPVNSGASSHSDTGSEEEEDDEESSEGEDDEEDEELEDEDDEEAEDDEDATEDDDDERQARRGGGGGRKPRVSTASEDDRRAAAMMDGEDDDEEDFPPTSALSKKDQCWLKRFKKLRAAKKGALPLDDIQRGVLPAEIIPQQVMVERTHRALIEAALARADEDAETPPLQDENGRAKTPLGGSTPTPKNVSLLQDCIRAYAYGVFEAQLATKQRIREQEYAYEHGLEQENEEADDEDEDQEEEEEEEEEDDEEGEDEEAEATQEEDQLKAFIKSQFKQRGAGKKNNNKKSEDDVALEEVDEQMDALSLNRASAASSAAAATPAAAASPALAFSPLVPVVATATEAERASHSQAVSPQPNTHHVAAHKPHKKHSPRKEEVDRDEEEDIEPEDEEPEDEEEVAEDEEGEDDGEDEEDEESEAGSEDEDDKFPYERNIFSLCPSYHFIKRLYACADAVTYKAYSKLTHQIVAIKICDGYDGETTPKEVRLLNSSQGHPNICVMLAWHPFPTNRCYAIVTEFVENVPIEKIFDQPKLHKIYMRDLLAGLQHMHERGLIFRDIKPSNVLWSEEKQKAIIIDYDVGSYFDPVKLHRSMVGTDGYMSTEMLLIKRAKRARLPLPYKGYDIACDVYAAGMVLGQLLYGISEDCVADLDNDEAKGPAFIARALELAERGGATLGHHLLLMMLHPEPHLRCTVAQARAHPWFQM